MTAPQIISRALTFKFAQSVSLSTGRPDIMEVAIIPLDDASSATSGATFAGGLKSNTIELSQPLNILVFDLIPSYSPGLQSPIQYRVMWRAGITSRTYTYDFSMPDADLDWEQLAAGIGNVIDGEAYLQITDLGIPGRVARLNSSGQVVDSSGVPVATGSDLTTINGLISTEKNARLSADSSLRSTLETELNIQVASTLSSANIYTNNQIVDVNSDLTTERSARQGADADLQSQLTTKTGALQAAVDSLAASTGGATDALSHKADLDSSGHVPVAQIPDSILTNAFGAADQAAMLALSPMVVHKGSVVIRPDGVWLLTTSDPSVLSNWVSLTTVSSVNSKRGAITLTAADVGAIPTGGSIASSQVTGLSTALSTKANQTDLTTLNATVSNFVGDPTLVHTSSGVVPASLLDSTTVFINSSGQLVKKDGTIIPISGGGGGGAVFSVNSKTGLVVLTASDVGAIPTGGAVSIGQVTGLSTTLGNKADLDLSGKVPVAEVPSLPQSQITGLATALSTKADLVSGLVPLAQVPTVPQSGVAGLPTLFTSNGLSTSSNAVNRISSLEGQVASGGVGGGGGVSSIVPFYTSPNILTPVTDLTNQVNLHSPWGIDSDGTITGLVGTWYYLYVGVRAQDVAYPFITENGHLSLRKWNESNPSDPVYAQQSDLNALITTVGTKANGSDLTTLTATVATKANSSDLTTLSTRVDTKAAQADLNAANTAIAGKASSSDLANLATTVALKANQSALDTTNANVGARALQTDLTAVTNRTSTIETTLTTKADLSGGVLATAQVPNIAQAKITGLIAALAAKADLDGSSKILVAQLPTNIPQANITGLGTSLGNKADLVAGYIPMSQIPLGALPNIQAVANRAAMLLLSLAQVQYGDLALITGTTDKGTYVLTGNDPSIFSNWTLLTTPDAPVTGVNGQTGNVVLDAGSVGALAASASIPQSQITGLSTALASFATSTSVVSGLAGKASPADVQNMFYLSSMIKRADYVATTSVSLSGQQTVDGILMTNGSIVLTTAQSASAQNGLWVVNGGAAWTRPADYATNSWMARDTVVYVSNTASTNPGSFNYSLWQAVAPSGTTGYTGTFIDAGQTAWRNYGWVAPPFIPIAGNGIGVTGSTLTAVSAPTVPNTGGGTALAGGLTTTTTGVAVDPASIPRKYLTTLNVNASTMTVTHNLNTTTPQVSIWDAASNALVLSGITVANPQSISIEFGSPSGSYRVCVTG
jgi:hypothetical protein